jgi:hypothetical protein
VKAVAWSFSALTAFETCARRYELTKVSKLVKEPPTAETLWGNRVHKSLEHRIADNLPLPEGMTEYETIVAKIISKGGVVRAEQKMALNRNLVPVEYFAPDVWVRGITDITVIKGTTVFNGDWKTGKTQKNSAQLRLSAALVMAHKPFIAKSVNAFIWLKTGTVDTEIVMRGDLSAIWREFIPRVQRLEIAVAENKFPPKPSGLCKNYCPCTTCEYHGK